MREILGDISATYRPGFLIKIWYLVYNFIRGVFGQFSIRKFYFWEAPINILPLSADSPGRQYIDAFLQYELPKIMSIGEVRVLDIGCGSGYFRSILAKVGYSGTYTGLDVTKDRRYSNDVDNVFISKFIEKKIEDFYSSERYDLVVSNTALEHVCDDIVAVKKSTQLTKKRGMQVHIVPAFSSLFLYLWHGYRQYTPRRIKKLFKGQKYVVHRLGGVFSFALHLFWITVPERLFGNIKPRQMVAYPKMVETARKFDKFLPFGSSMYIIIVSS